MLFLETNTTTLHPHSIHLSILPHFPAQHTSPSGHIPSFHQLVHYLCAHHSPSINISPDFKVFNQIFEYSHTCTPYMVTTTLPAALASTALVPGDAMCITGMAMLGSALQPTGCMLHVPKMRHFRRFSH